MPLRRPRRARGSMMGGVTRRGVAAQSARADSRSAAGLVGVRALALAAHRLDRCRSIDEVAHVAASTAVEMLEAQRVAFCRIDQDTCRIVVVDPPPVDPREVWMSRASYRAADRPALRGLIRDRASWVAHARTVHDEPTVPEDPDAGDPVEVDSLRDVDASSGLASPIIV